MNSSTRVSRRDPVNIQEWCLHFQMTSKIRLLRKTLAFMPRSRYDPLLSVCLGGGMQYREDAASNKDRVTSPFATCCIMYHFDPCLYCR